MRIPAGLAAGAALGVVFTTALAPFGVVGLGAAVTIGAVSAGFSFLGFDGAVDEFIQFQFGTEDHEFVLRSSDGQVLAGVNFQAGLGGLTPLQAVRELIDYAVTQGVALDGNLSVRHSIFDDLANSFSVSSNRFLPELTAALGVSPTEFFSLSGARRDGSEDSLTNSQVIGTSSNGEFLILDNATQAALSH